MCEEASFYRRWDSYHWVPCSTSQVTIASKCPCSEAYSPRIVPKPAPTWLCRAVCPLIVVPLCGNVDTILPTRAQSRGRDEVPWSAPT